LCGVALALLVALPEQAAPQECPGITSAELSGAAVTCANSNCPTGPGSFITDIIAQLCDVNTFGALPATCTTCECCKEPITNLAAGTVLELIGPDPKNDCDLGGRGRAIGEAALCLLRDLANEARSPSLGGPGIRREDGFSIEIGQVDVEQRVGFLSFDPPARRMRGFHAISICVPVLGCIGNQTQEFTATLVQKQGETAGCGDYHFTDPWLLVVKTEDVEHNLGVEVGPFIVYTPVGPIHVKPRLDYEANFEAVTSPWANGNIRTLHQPNPCAKANLVDVYGASDVLFASSLAALDVGLVMGWDSILGMGGRDPKPLNPIWSPAAQPFPQRPDLDFSMARDADEKRPVNRMVATVQVSYGLDELGIKLNLGPFSLRTANVFVSAHLGAAFASQFQLLFDEGRYIATMPDGCNPMASTGVTLQSAVSAFAELLIEAGVHIDFVLDLSPFGEKHFNFLKTAPVIHPTTPAPVPMLGPAAFARIVTAEPPPPGPALYNEFQSFSGGMEDGRSFVDQCLNEPPPPAQMPPDPEFTPGDPRDLLEPLQFPCNICVFLPPTISTACLPKKTLVTAGTIPPDYDCGFAVNGQPCTDPNCENVAINPPKAVNLHEVLFPVSQAGLPADLRWMCDAVEKSGCFDLCTVDPAASEPLVLEQSAVSTIGTVCRDGIGNGGGTIEGHTCTAASQCDDGNPCTDESCVIGGEFGTCHLTANQSPCNDGSFCNGPDTCALGICGAHAGNPCAATGDCCKEDTDSCADTCPDTPCGDKSAGDPCDDGDVCTIDDHCIASLAGLLCRGDPAITCTAPDVCTANICQEVDGDPECVGVASGACPPECGDGGLDPGEECDGSADSRCPGQCRPDCRCPSIQRRGGEPCSDSTDCLSGNCVDDVCCNTACEGADEECGVAGQEGICQSLRRAAPVPLVSGAGLAIAGLVLIAIGRFALLGLSRSQKR
jgi:hypothetical protein